MFRNRKGRTPPCESARQGEPLLQCPFDCSFFHERRFAYARSPVSTSSRGGTAGRRSSPCTRHRIPWHKNATRGSPQRPRIPHGGLRVSPPDGSIVGRRNTQGRRYTVAAAAATSITANCTVTTAGRGGGGCCSGVGIAVRCEAISWRREISSVPSPPAPSSPAHEETRGRSI